MSENEFDTHPGGLALIRCDTRAELRSARQFRSEVFQTRRGFEFPSLAELRSDEAGHVFLLTQQGGPRATARVQSISDPELPAQLARENRPFGADSVVSRIAALRSPEGARLSLVVMVLGAMWLSENTSHRRYLAYCHPKLVQLYELVGAKDTGSTIDVEDRPEPYSVLVGDYAVCVESGLACLESIGFSRAQAMAAVRWSVGQSRDRHIVDSAG